LDLTMSAVEVTLGSSLEGHPLPVPNGTDNQSKQSVEPTRSI